MDAAFENYLALSDLLLSDGEIMLGVDLDDSRWQRNFIRAVVALIEGYGHCFRDMAVIGLDCDGPTLSADEEKVLRSESSLGVCDRIKFTLRAAYAMFSISPAPDFGTDEWCKAKEALEKRHSLMHPKTPSDLEITPIAWERMRAGLTWLVERHFDLIRLLHERHSQKGS